MTVYAYIILDVCLIAAAIYICVLLRRITKLNEYIKWLDARTKPATEIIAVKQVIDTYTMAKEHRFKYLDFIVERMIHNLANEITRRLHDRLYKELTERIRAHKEIFFCSPVNLEYSMDIRIPVYRVDWETMYLNGERINELDHDRCYR